MRPALRWLLLLTLALSAGAIWWPPSGVPPLVSAVRRDVDRAHGLSVAPAAESQGSSAQQALPAVIPALQIDPARRDIFASAQGGAQQASQKAPSPGRPLPAPPPPVPLAQPAQAIQPAQPAVAAAAPPLRLRYLGSMLTPAGERLVLMARGDAAFVARPGLNVDDGYAIQSVEAHAVRVVHSGSGNVTDIPIPTTLQSPQGPR